MVDYRPVPESDLDAYRGVLDYAFRAEAGPDPDHDDEPSPLADRRGLYDGDTLVTTAGGLEADDAVLKQLGTLFPPRERYLREFF